MNAFSVCLVSFFVCRKGVEDMNPTLKDQLKEWEKKNSFQRPKKKKPMEKKPAAKKKEKLSKSDLIYLMGMNRPRYSRGRGGAWRSNK
jgi:hypothetical protein